MATQLQLLITMIASSFGTGILSMPWSMAGASVIPSILIIFVVAVLMAITVGILVAAAEKHKKYDLGSLLGLLPGRAGVLVPVLVNTALWATVWLTLVGYIITIQDALEGFAPGRRVLTAVVSSAVILPLCFLDMSKLSITSTISVLTTLNLFVLTSHTLATNEIEVPKCWCGFGPGLIATASMSSTCMVVQMCALPMFEELDQRTPRKFIRITALAFAALFAIYAAFATIGYLSFGPGIQANILKSLPDTAWGKTSRLIYLLVIMSAYPIFVYPITASVRKSEALQRSSVSINALSNATTVGVVISVMLAAMVLNDLGVINVVVGAVQCAVFVGIVPGLVGIFLLDPKTRSGVWTVSMISLAVVCTVVGILGIFYTDNYVQSQHCRWSTATVHTRVYTK